MLFETIAVLGLGMNILGQLSGASAQADAQRRNAAMKNAQADELLARQLINEEVMREQAEHEAGYASGPRGSAGTGIGQKLAIKNALDRNLELSRREANFKVKMLREGADIDMKLASDVQTAGYWSAAGTLLGGGADIYRRSDLYGKGSKSDDLSASKSKNKVGAGVDWGWRDAASTV